MTGPHWNAETLCQRLEPLCPGIGVEVVVATGSTSTDLIERVRSAGLAGMARFAPCLRVAESQHAGRGRHGRTWQAERGASLTFSLAVELPAADPSGLSLAVGVALAEALDPGAAPRVRLKWPNDLWLVDAGGPGRKLGGVLIETVPFGASRVAVIGVGLNLRRLAGAADCPTGCAGLDQLDGPTTAPAALARVAPALAAAVHEFGRAGFAAFRARYARRDLLAGRLVRTTQPDVPAGIADGRVAEVSSGEVSVRLAADEAAVQAAS
jgi:BirA family biotin operon repressor/biotin-[acetyl-CoA-carboxylase] ligase